MPETPSILTPLPASAAHGSAALVLPGGGARGAYQVGVLKAIAEIHGPGAQPFSVFCGTSAGSINAVVMASHARDFMDGAGRLEQFWSNLGCSQVYRTDPWSVLSSAARWLLSLGSGGFLKFAPRALLDNGPLRELLVARLQLENIEAAIMSGDLQGVAVTASGYTQAAAVSFFQAPENQSEWRRERRQGLATTINVDHLMASVALPLLFPAQRIGNEFFGDGGMRMVAPLSPAIHLGARKILVIGTRDEKPDAVPETPAVYPSPGEIGGYLLDTIFMDRLNADLARLNRINRTLSLMKPEQRAESKLKPVDNLVIRPSRDLRHLTAEHAPEIPVSVRLLLRTLGGWGSDWRMASYLLFEPAYCRALIQLGYEDGICAERKIRDFLNAETA